MPQATAQKVQVFRVSVPRVSLNGRTEAASASPAMPKPRAPMPDAARLAPLSLTNPRRLSSMAPPPILPIGDDDSFGGDDSLLRRQVPAFHGEMSVYTD